MKQFSLPETHRQQKPLKIDPVGMARPPNQVKLLSCFREGNTCFQLLRIFSCTLTSSCSPTPTQSLTVLPLEIHINPKRIGWSSKSHDYSGVNSLLNSECVRRIISWRRHWWTVCVWWPYKQINKGFTRWNERKRRHIMANYGGSKMEPKLRIGDRGYQIRNETLKLFLGDHGKSWWISRRLVWVLSWGWWCVYTQFFCSAGVESTLWSLFVAA